MLELITLSLIILFGCMTIAYLISVVIKNSGIVDVFWGIGIAVVSTSLGVFYGVNDVSRVSIVLICLWALRLAVFLFLTRILKGERDKRYTSMEEKWGKKKNVKTLLNFYLQASLQVLICFALFPLFLDKTVEFTNIHGVLVLLFLTALSLEAVSDLQLYRFKKSGNQGLCKVGLWKISRHPNLFFECSIWLILSLMTYGTEAFLWSFISPISIILITRVVTGPYTERFSAEKYGQEFEEYKNTVPMMVPFIGNLFLRK